MSRTEVLAASRVPNTRTVFFLGCFDKRVTLYSQQVRALNLAAAILTTPDVLRPQGGRIAIIGGGVAGVTTALAFAKAASGLETIDIYECDKEVMHLQQRSGRFLHPHNYDWPVGGSSQDEAGLSILNWSAGPARDVHAHLLAEFDAAKASDPRLHLYTECRVTKVTPLPLSLVRVEADNFRGKAPTYDTVILAIGFGLERFLDRSPSYWNSTGLEERIISEHEQLYFISGNGDGGLVDFLIAAFDGRTHSEICRFLMGLDLGAAGDILEDIEQRAWAAGANLDIFGAYRDELIPQVPPGVIADVHDQLRDNARAILHTSEPFLFKRESAVLNRLGVALALAADAQANPPRLETIVGVPFEGGAPELNQPIKLEGRAALNPDRRILRLGPDGGRNLAPFQDLVDRVPSDARIPLAGYRPATPTLIAEANQLFGGFVSPAAPPAAESENEDDVPTVRLRIDGQPQALVVSGAVAAAVQQQAWAESRVVVVDCALRPSESPPLVAALARFCGHASSSLIHARDRRAWEAALGQATDPRGLPGNIPLVFAVREARELPAAEGLQTDAQTFAEALNVALDAETLRELDQALHEVLALAPSASCGWEIEAQLRAELWTLWTGWRATLEAHPVARRRFLLLLADEKDFQSDDALPLVRVGPRTVPTHLLKGAVFALAFVAGTDLATGPSQAHPGNLSGDAVKGHACGVSWIEGLDLGPDVAARAWSTPIVLLAELRTPPELMAAEARLDRDPSAPPRVGEPASAERPLILGAERRWLEALAAGLPAVTAYLGDLLQWRADRAAAQMESET